MCSKFSNKIAILWLLPLAASAQISPLFDSATSVLLAPANLWTANQAGLSNALATTFQPRAATNFLNELVVTNGITLGGVRQTAWPSGGASTIVTPLPLPGTWYQAGTSLYFLWSSTNSMPVLVNDPDAEWSIRCNAFVDQTISAMPSQITVISKWRPIVGNTASQTLVAGVAVQQWRDSDAFGTEVLSTNTVNAQTWITATNILTSLDGLVIGQGFTLKVARKATSASDTSTNLAHFGGAIIKWQ